MPECLFLIIADRFFIPGSAQSHPDRDAFLKGAFTGVVKVIVLTLGAGGVATRWEVVIADVGVALLAILNAVPIQRMKV